jgi:hypothetical protein
LEGHVRETGRDCGLQGKINANGKQRLILIANRLPVTAELVDGKWKLEVRPPSSLYKLTPAFEDPPNQDCCCHVCHYAAAPLLYYPPRRLHLLRMHIASAFALWSRSVRVGL